MANKTWEYLVRPEQPIRASELDIILHPGIGSRLADNPELYSQVHAYWNKTQIDNLTEGIDDLISARKHGDIKEEDRIKNRLISINPKVRLSDASIDGNVLNLYIGMTNFLEWVGTNIRALDDSEFRTKLMSEGKTDADDPEHYFSNPLAVCALVYCLDPKDTSKNGVCVPVGLRSGRVHIYPNMYHLFAGTVDASSDLSKTDIIGKQKEELMEELGVNYSEMADPLFYGIIRQTVSRIPEVIWSMGVTTSEDELVRRWQQNSPVDIFEHKKITFLHGDEIINFYDANKNNMVPSGAAVFDAFIRNTYSKLR